MSTSSQNEGDPSRIEEQAAAWIWRQERGLEPAEEREFSQWLAADPRHGASLARQSGIWSRLDQRSPNCGRGRFPRPIPTLLEPPARRMRWPLYASLAAAAALVVILYHPRPGAPAVELTQAASTADISDLTLKDGSHIELNRGAAVTVRYTAGERQVRLDRGEAQFVVAKNPAWPFVVDAGGVRVRAVGTAFDVSLAAGNVAVIVTEGRVRLEDGGDPNGSWKVRNLVPAAFGHADPSHDRGRPARLHPALGGGEPRADLRDLGGREMQQFLAWQLPASGLYGGAAFRYRGRIQPMQSCPIDDHGSRFARPAHQRLHPFGQRRGLCAPARSGLWRARRASGSGPDHPAPGSRRPRGARKPTAADRRLGRTKRGILRFFLTESSHSGVLGTESPRHDLG